MRISCVGPLGGAGFSRPGASGARARETCRLTFRGAPAFPRHGTDQNAAYAAGSMSRGWRLIGADGAPYESAEPGTLGGHRRSKIYGRLDCRGAARWIARGHYVRHRVFFRDEPTAIAAGYRPCADCLSERYAEWKADPAQFRARHG